MTPNKMNPLSGITPRGSDLPRYPITIIDPARHPGSNHWLKWNLFFYGWFQYTKTETISQQQKKSQASEAVAIWNARKREGRKEPE
jgi:hypothetical protein